MVLVLFETPAGYALFKMADASKMDDVDNIFKHFETPAAANKTVKLKAFDKFENTVDALTAVTALIEGELSKGLKKFLKNELDESDLKDKLLPQAIAKKFKISVAADAASTEVMRGIRAQILSFPPDKVDTMIIQAIHLLDDLDKELNTYAMRCKEWFGWHFPEMTKILVDNVAYAKNLRRRLRRRAEISMGTEISDEDIENISHLCEQIISISEYRQQLYDYLKNRMGAIAPNLTCLVGELVGARLIAHAGSLILGAEKALFRALKAKHDTPKYGLIYHASLVGQAGPKIKGKIARTVATKAALSVRVDALGEADGPTVGIELRAKIENRLKQLEEPRTTTPLPTLRMLKPSKKRKAAEEEAEEEPAKEENGEKKKKKKKEKKVEEVQERRRKQRKRLLNKKKKVKE
ncbi:hypothetical protein BC829DRAFT_425887 [Chytridium lagenaria]|nr:hypothetical protein BC829DRAFT_425887 [Chytridium lagenaria]